ncbi:MAG: diacylglycerol kinase family protein [Bacteroidota bacterium]
MLKREVKSFGYAIKGVISAFKSEKHLQFHLLAAAAVTALGFWLKLNTIEWSIIIICIAMVFVAELFNTAIEKLVDLVSPEYNKTAGLIKDVAAGAVLLASIAAAIVGVLVIGNKCCTLY